MDLNTSSNEFSTALFIELHPLSTQAIAIILGSHLLPALVAIIFLPLAWAIITWAILLINSLRITWCMRLQWNNSNKHTKTSLTLNSLDQWHFHKGIKKDSVLLLCHHFSSAYFVLLMLQETEEYHWCFIANSHLPKGEYHRLRTRLRHVQNHDTSASK